MLSIADGVCLFEINISCVEVEMVVSLQQKTPAKQLMSYLIRKS